MTRTTPRRRESSSEETVTVAELVGRARTVALPRKPDDTMPMPAVSAAESRARHRRPGARGGARGTEGFGTRLALGGAAVVALSVFAVIGGFVTDHDGGVGRPPGDIADGAEAPEGARTLPVVTIEGVAHPRDTAAGKAVPTASSGARQARPRSPDATRPRAPEPRSEPEASAPEPDPRERAREAVERRFEEWESRANEMPGVPDW